MTDDTTLLRSLQMARNTLERVARGDRIATPVLLGVISELMSQEDRLPVPAFTRDDVALLQHFGGYRLTHGPGYMVSPYLPNERLADLADRIAAGLPKEGA